ncbi:KLHDC9 [Branchiostoma lanceolatum]|uniref:KLHDC9 protein n=1 Tax=Branchiostoma lanceolatum TaxID=7740 RepID=A0A8J9Z544_BRALA|nr:KLHDC9 [Branchiostoma lanceolatum]
MSGDRGSSLPWSWQQVSSCPLAARVSHTCNVVGGRLVIFGGTSVAQSKEPLNDVVVFDPVAGWEKVRCKTEGPARSHHAAVTILDRYVCVVGGWDGKQRTSAVSLLDTESFSWSDLCPGPGNDPPAGLSSHTCTKLSETEMLVVGREGGVRMQRRFGSVFHLKVDAEKGQYEYREAAYHASSRSGHTANVIKVPGEKTCALMVFGGRDSGDYEIIGTWKPSKIKVEEARCSDLEAGFTKLIEQGVAKKQAPKGVHHHTASTIGRYVVVYGGECFARARDTVCHDIFLFDTGGKHAIWYHLKPWNEKNSLKRSGHATCILNGQMLVVGGVGPDAKTPCGDIYSLKIN